MAWDGIGGCGCLHREESQFPGILEPLSKSRVLLERGSLQVFRIAEQNVLFVVERPVPTAGIMDQRAAESSFECIQAVH